MSLQDEMEGLDLEGKRVEDPTELFSAMTVVQRGVVVIKPLPLL